MTNLTNYENNKYLYFKQNNVAFTVEGHSNGV